MFVMEIDSDLEGIPRETSARDLAASEVRRSEQRRGDIPCLGLSASGLLLQYEYALDSSAMCNMRA